MKLNENPYGLQFLIFNIGFDDDKLPMSLINTESMLTKSEGGPTIRSIDLVMDFLMQIVHDLVCDSRDQQMLRVFG